MNLLRSRCLAVLPQVDFSVFPPKSGKERRLSGYLRPAAMLAALCLGSAGAWAATLTVNTTADSSDPAGSCGSMGTCSLRDAISQANSGDRILFSVTGTIPLGSALPLISQNLTITGPGANQLTISGGGNSVFSITSGTVSISGLTISGGKAGNGAAIEQASGSLTVTGCEFASNSSTSTGGAINAIGSLTVSGSTFTNNSAEFGGAIFANAGLTLTNSTFSGNSATDLGGAVDAAGTIAITNSTFSGDSASSGGDEIYNVGTLTANNNIFTGNSASFAGGILNAGGGTIAAASNNLMTGDAGGECSGGSGCPSNGSNGNQAGSGINVDLSPLGYYGGQTMTFLPEPGSAAICAGSASAALTAGLNFDQRGFAMDPSSYTPCAVGSVDAGAVQANYIEVQAGGDAGAGASDCQGMNCTLRDAIDLANTAGGDIDFAPGVSSVTLSSAGTTLELSGTAGINIVGSGTSTVTVIGGGPTSNFSVFTVDANVPALLYGLTISNGYTNNNGGGIDNFGALTVADSTISGNSASLGGGIENWGSGTLTVIDATISGDSAISGGGIANSGTLRIGESTVSGNFATSLTVNSLGGGILSSGGVLDISNVTIVGNSASGTPAAAGGGIYVGAGTVKLDNTVVSANTNTNGSDANIVGSFTNSGGNVIGGGTNVTNNLVGGTGAQITLSPLQLNGIGATVQTMIPLPGSPAICAGASVYITATELTTDERGYPLQPAGGYCLASEIDAGAVQTNYTSANFVQQPSGIVAVNTDMASPAIIQVLETDTLLSNTDGVNGIPLSLTLTTDNAHLVNGSATTAGTGASAGEATFTNLQVSAPEMDDTLSLAAVAVGSVQLGPLTSDQFSVIGPATVLLVSAPASTTVGAPFSVTVTAYDAAGNIASGYTGTVQFTSSDPGTALVLPVNYTFTTGAGKDNGVHTFANGVTLVTAPTQTVTATDTVTNTITGFATVPVNKATPTAAVTLTSGTNPSTLNQSLTFTATVTPPNGTVALSGASTVSFTITDTNHNTVNVCTSAVMVTWNPNSGNGNATATCTTAALTASGSPFTIAATYNGDSNYNTATAPTINQTVQKLAPTLTLTTPSSTTSFNGMVTFTATLGLSSGSFVPTGPTGTVSFTVGVNPITCISGTTGIVNSATEVATCTTNALPVGMDVIGATYPGDANYITATAPTINQTVQQLAPTLALSVSPSNSTNLNQSVTFTATLSGVAFAPTGPTGTVSFTVGGSPITCVSGTTGLVTSSTGVATCTTNALLAGTDVIGANYPGDSNFKTAIAPTINQNVAALPATLSLTPSPLGTVSTGTSVTFTAQLAAAAITPVTPSGTVTWSSNTGCAPTLVTLVSGVWTATCMTSALVSPADVITATYGNDTNFTVAAPPTITETVGKTAAVTTLISSLPTGSVVNQTVTFTATVKPPSGTVEPTGNITFAQGATTLCGGPVGINTSNQTATCSYTFGSQTAGATITATYSGDQNFSAGTPGTLVEVVNQAPTTATVTSTPNPSAVNQTVTFTAIVAPNAPAGNTPTSPTGKVTFSYVLNAGPSVTLCGSVPVVTNSGVTSAPCTATLPSKGSYTITAAYTGDQNFASTSGTETQTVNADATTTTVAALPSTLAVNTSVTFTATISPTPPAPSQFTGSTNPTGTVTFSYTLNGGASVNLCQAVPVSTASSMTTAPCPTALPSSGNYTITAAYSTGDQNFASSTGTLIQAVGLTATTTAVSGLPSSSAVNQPVIFSATVTPGVSGSKLPTGTVTFSYTSSTVTTPVNLCAPVTVSTAAPITAQCTAPLPLKGSYTIAATYNGDQNFAASTVTAPQTVNTAATATTVVYSPTPLNVNTLATFTATIAPQFTGSTNPTGAVAFSYTLNGGSSVPLTQCASVPVSTTAGVTTAVCSGAGVSLPTAGTYIIKALYTSGDTNFSSSSGTTASISVGAPTTTTTVAASVSPSVVNQAVTFTATITPSVPGSTSPTGTVKFSYTTSTVTTPVVICASSNVSTTAGVATAACTAALPANGTYTITAAYSGDTNFGPSSGPAIQIVNAASTTTVVVVSPPSSTVNQQVTVTATVTPAIAGSTNPTGTVAFSYSGPQTGTLCTAIGVSTTAGVTTAVCTGTGIALPATGTYAIKATYTTGDANFASSSGVATQAVSATGTTIKVTAAPSPSSVNQLVTFTATVTPGTAGSTNPTGTVAFSYAENSPGTLTGSPCPSVNVTTASGVTTASCPFALPATGTYTITAAYTTGDTNFISSPGTATQSVSATAATTLTLQSSQPISVASSPVNFNAILSPSLPAGERYTSAIVFTSNDPANSANAQCGGPAGLPVTASSNATCQVVFKNESSGTTPFVVTANYLGDSNFAASTSNPVQQTVENFSVAFTAPPSGTTEYLTQGFSNSTDPITATPIQVTVTTSEGTAHSLQTVPGTDDTLAATCVVLNSAGKVVTDGSVTCAPSPATLQPATGTGVWTYTLSATSSAAVGQYTTTLTATDQQTPLAQTTPALTFYVVGQAAQETVVPGVAATEDVNFNTSYATLPATLESFACGKIWDVTTSSFVTTTGLFKCTGPSTGVTLPFTSVPITITPTGVTVAQLQKSTSISMAAFLWVPLFALLTWFGSRKSPRRNFFRFLGLILLALGLSYSTGCGGSYSLTPSPTTGTGAALPGTYLVQVIAFDGPNQTGNKYYAVVSVVVNSN